MEPITLLFHGGIDSFDGGIGMMQALGAQFYNDEGELLDAREGAQVIKFIRRIDFSAIPQNFKDAHIQLMSDFLVNYMVSIVKL